MGSFDEEKCEENQNNQDKTCERKRRYKVKDFQCQIDASIDFGTSNVIDVDAILGDTIDTCDSGTDPALDDNQELLRSLEDKLRKSTSALETEQEKNVEMRKKYEKCQDSRQQKWKENREMLE